MKCHYSYVKTPFGSSIFVEMDKNLPLIEVKDLSVSFKNDQENEFFAVKNISFSMRKGRVTAIVGESGSGKSLTALSFLQLLPKEASVSGKILFNNNEGTVKILDIPSSRMRDIRGKHISMIFQEPMTSLNPVYTCGYQIVEAIKTHENVSNKEAVKMAVKLLSDVNLPHPELIMKRYPHQISGGQKQRVMIAMAMSCNPQLLIADEPTTALDVGVQKSIMELIKKLQKNYQLSVVLITHDLSLVAEFADDIIVMYKGEIVETGETLDVLKVPKHNYTKALLACKPSPEQKGKRLSTLQDIITNGDNCNNLDKYQAKKLENKISANILIVDNLTVKFPASKNIFGKTLTTFTAVDDVSFSVQENETIGLVGESGCGKTTLGRAILHLIKPTSGKIILNGRDIATASKNEMRVIRKDLQIVFQDPYGSLNPRITIGDAILEPLHVHHSHTSTKERKEKVTHLLEQVGLKGDHFKRYPHQFSGGQRQRICIARALALNPSFLIFDESLSALDVSVQAQILNLINDLKSQYRFTSIFISHDLAVVHYISDRIMVMNKGKIIEEGNAHDVFYNPKDEYTQKLIEAIPGKGIKPL